MIGYTYFLFALLATVLVLVIIVTFTLARKLAVLKTKTLQKNHQQVLKSVHEQASLTQVQVASSNDEDNEEQNEISRLESRLSLFAEMFEGARTNSFAAMMYYIVFLTRRMVIITAAFCLNDFPVFQIALLTLASLGNAVYLAAVNPFEDSSVTHLELFNEIGVYFAIMHVWILIDPTLSPSTLSDLGFSMIGFCLFFLLVSMVHVSRGSVRLTMKKCKTRIQRFKSKIDAWDRGSELCPCKCFHCGNQTPKFPERAQMAKNDFKLTIVKCKAGEDLWSIDTSRNVLAAESTRVSSKQLRYRQGAKSPNEDLQPSAKADRLKEWCQLEENVEDLDEETKCLHRNNADLLPQNDATFTEYVKGPLLLKPQTVNRSFLDIKNDKV